MFTQVIMLNGGSSSGKSTLARRLQEVLPHPWLTLGVDTLVEALPPALRLPGEGIGFGPGGEISTGEVFRQLDVAWSLGVAAMVRAGARVIVDEVFLGGAASQARWRGALTGLEVLWVGVRCDPRVAEVREAARADRVSGMARVQADRVHEGVTYDLEVNTAHWNTEACARLIQARLT